GLSHASGILDTIGVASLGPYTAGVGTNTIFIDYGHGDINTTADPGTRVDLQLLDNGVVISNALRTDGANNTYFITSGSTTYGLGIGATLFTCYRAGASIRVQAVASVTTTAPGGGEPNPSLAFVVNAGPAKKLIVYASGETLLEGRDDSIVTT